MNRKLRILGFYMLLTGASLEALAQQNNGQNPQASEWVQSLQLNDHTKEERVVKMISTHLTAIREWHNSHPASAVPAGINPVTGEKLSELHRQMIADSAIPDSIHRNLMSGLRANLSEEQVNAILDKYTIGKVDFTMKAYKEIVPDMTEKEEATIRRNLETAREMAVDYKSMKEISAIFEIYKTKNEQYLNNNGRSWRQMYSDYVKKLKAEKAKK